jgi:hypothetical protein
MTEASDRISRLDIMRALADMITEHMLDEEDWLIMPNRIHFHDHGQPRPVVELNMSRAQALSWCAALGVDHFGTSEAGVWNVSPIQRGGWLITITGYDSVNRFDRFNHPSLHEPVVTPAGA